MLSFIVPAHNEEEHVGPTVASIAAAARATGEAFEVIVVADCCTDRTSEIAAAHGARVIAVQHRQIAATRNAGARAAGGDVLFFVDADTLSNLTAVTACLREIRRGAVGGGCVFELDGILPLWARLLYPAAVVSARFLKLVGGCFLFCRRDVFEAFGGFDPRFFAAEEVAFINALKARGRFAVPGPTVVTSGRKLRDFSMWHILGIAWKWAVGGPTAFQRREGLDIWYGERTYKKTP
ncbi:glycosyltransferase [Limnoglobus roseus]|uniref:GT2 family glycosyltransferase n=1 Tax=Limnoglobus roseus TaxID=2598579 RepID=A0A5C1A3J0_9BACT|nr:glycosyltransferase [Limnoglobus roseus]QEL13150.1 GT2 family glycosyltransferase [Limnoglobus roseus]